MYNILDLFCGTGSFAHGFLKRSPQFKLLCSIDILKNATETVRLNHPDTVVLTEDIRNIKLSNLKKKLDNKSIDIIIGGPPCQGFSSIRPNRSSIGIDLRNNLFQEFARFVDYFKPKVFVLENVVGILTHNHGKTLSNLIDCFNATGYKTSWMVLNSANYGVPQKRERFILIGTKNNIDIKFPPPTHSYNGKVIGYRDKSKIMKASQVLKNAVTVEEAINDLPPLNSREKSNTYYSKPKNEFQNKMRGSCKILTLHEASNHSDKMLEIIKHAGDNIASIPSHLISSGFSSCYSRMRPNEPANTITVKFRSPSSNKCIHPFQDRSITIREAARLQSFEDSFLFAGSNTDISSLIGNAVPSLLGNAIAESVLYILNQPKLRENKKIEPHHA